MTRLAEPHRAAGMRAAAGRDAIGVVRDVIDAVERHAEPFGEELREAGLVALAADIVPMHQLDPASGATVISARSRGTPLVISM